MESRKTKLHLIQKWHAKSILPSRFQKLADLVQAALPPETESFLDVGAGSGQIARRLHERHPAWRVAGVDVLARRDSVIPVEPFDGRHLPFGDKSFDVVLLIDVLHHAEDPRKLLTECARVARRRILVKDHSQENWLDRWMLQVMDWVGNASYGVKLPYHYWSQAGWDEIYQGLPLEVLERKVVALYPFPFSMLMAKHLQIFHTLRPSQAENPSP